MNVEAKVPFRSAKAEQAVLPPGGISRRDWLRAVAQLSEYGLIDWTPLEDKSGMGQLSGFAKINDSGVEVLEGGVAPPISISIDKSRRTTVPRRNKRRSHRALRSSRSDYGRTGESDHRDQSSRCVGAGEK